MKHEYRYDRATVTPIASSNEFLRARVAIARPGVFPYLYTDGQIRFEAKLPEELFSEITIQSAKGAPVTDGHPPMSDSGGMVTPKNWQKYVRGAIGDDIEIIDNHLVAHETIFDAGLIDELKKGNKIEVSIGFETDIDPTQGEFEGIKYDCIQRNIRINHIAHVDKGRAGETVRAYLDSVPDGITIAVMNTDKEFNMKQKESLKQDENVLLEGMKKFFALFAQTQTRKDGIEEAQKAAESAKEAVEQTPAPKSEEEANAQKEQIALLKAQIEALQALLAEKTKMLEEATSPATLDAAITERLSLIDIARHCVPDFKHDGLKNRDIKLAVISKVLPFAPGVKIEDVSDVVVDARFDASVELVREKAARHDNGCKPMLDESEIAKKRMARLNLYENKGGIQ
jgi:hypothetical protein